MTIAVARNPSDMLRRHTSLVSAIARACPPNTDPRNSSGGGTQRFVPDSLKLRTARFEHAHQRFAELSPIDHGFKLCAHFLLILQTEPAVEFRRAPRLSAPIFSGNHLHTSTCRFGNCPTKLLPNAHEGSFRFAGSDRSAYHAEALS